MTTHNFETPYGTSPFDRSTTSLLDLVREMEGLGMDPRPLFHIAANDILANHGIRALPYAEIMRDEMVQTGDSSGIYLWEEIHSILSGPTSGASHRIH